MLSSHGTKTLRGGAFDIYHATRVRGKGTSGSRDRFLGYRAPQGRCPGHYGGVRRAQMALSVHGGASAGSPGARGDLFRAVRWRVRNGRRLGGRRPFRNDPRPSIVPFPGCLPTHGPPGKGLIGKVEKPCRLCVQARRARRLASIQPRIAVRGRIRVWPPRGARRSRRRRTRSDGPGCSGSWRGDCSASRSTRGPSGCSGSCPRRGWRCAAKSA